MLSAKNRLRKKKDIERVFKKGKGLKEGFLSLKLAKNDLKINRFAFIVSLKVAKKAVLRNRVRRRLRALVQNTLPETKKGFDIVLVGAPGLATQKFQEIEKSLNRLFKKARLWNPVRNYKFNGGNKKEL